MTLIAQCMEKEVRLAKRSRVLVAVSGGPDSMALLHALARLKPRLGIDVAAHGVDHGLRKEAKRELDLAAALAESLEVPFSRTKVRVAKGSNLQARARTARYEALRKAAEGAWIATAHHADDRAETVLIRMLRGSGPAELAVLPARSSNNDLVRPMIRARRSDVDSHLRRYGIAAASDPSNRDPHFLRTRVRMEVLPLLSSLDPKIVEHLCALADRLGAMAQGTGSAHIYPLPQATQTALAELVRNPRARSRILLPGGIVATSGGRTKS